VSGHRGPWPGDEQCFEPEQVKLLQRAVVHLSWLLSREYSFKSSLQLVGDRFQLVARQRLAVGRSACSDEARHRRRARCRPMTAVGLGPLLIDGFNLLITIESALAGGVLFAGRDGAIRDLASVHGSWRRVAETERAMQIIAAALATAGGPECIWFLDAPVSNSGRLCGILKQMAQERGLPWSVELTMNPDQKLAQASGLVVSSDALILDRAEFWVNVTETVLTTFDQVQLIHFDGEAGSDAGVDDSAERN